MSSLTDIFTVSKNIVTAINGLGQVYLSVQGSQVLNAISAATVVSTGQGRLVQVVVLTAGSTAGAAYDATASTATTNQIVSIPNTLGVTNVNIPTNNGIVIAPGTGQVITVSYS
jgi:hypothetical protein